MQRFQRSGSIEYQSRKKFVRASVVDKPKRFIRGRSQQLGLSKTLICRVLRFLALKVYNVQLTLDLKHWIKLLNETFNSRVISRNFH